jgi:hypothetical protein
MVSPQRHRPGVNASALSAVRLRHRAGRALEDACDWS